MDPIRKWFIDLDDGEFLQPRGYPYVVVPPSPTSKFFLYTTKRDGILSKFALDPGIHSFGVIGRYGLPDEEDVEWLKSAAGGRQFLFVGDADPPDLLVFSWLRSRLNIAFRGLNDTLLQKCGVILNDRNTIRLSPTEAAAMQLARQQLPDLVELLGPNCTALLNAGRKIEVEALISFATVEPHVMFDAMVG
jgi:hypothetical protein